MHNLLGNKDEYISWNYIKYRLERKFTNKKTSSKIKNFINSFLDRDLDFLFDDGKIYFSSRHSFSIKKEIEKIIKTNFGDFKTKVIKDQKPISSKRVKELISNHHQEIEKMKKQTNQEEVEEVTKTILSIPIEKCGFFDFEFWEDDTFKILEIGLSKIKNDKIETKHILIKETIELENHKFVKSQKFSRDNYVIKPLKDALQELDEFLKSNEINIGYGIRTDLNVLEKNNLKINDYVFFDIAEFLKRMWNNNDLVSLEKAAKELLGEDIDLSNLHNAADDAEFTLRLYLKILRDRKKRNKDGKKETS